MALLKCPDCGSWVSERAAACLKCGCPREFFENAAQITEEFTEQSSDDTTEKKQAKIARSEEKKDGKDETKEVDTEVLDSFTVLGMNITYYKNQEIYIKAAKNHRNKIFSMEKNIREIYHAAKDIDVVWDKIVPFVQNEINKIARDNIGVLYKQNIIISEEAFKQKYNLKYLDYLDSLVEAYDAIINNAKNLQTQRQYERSNRSHWQGGGFGLKGAIKGAVTAGALNMVTGAGRSIGDSIVDGNDRAALQNAKKALKKNEDNLELLVCSMRYCATEADIGLADEFVISRFTQRVRFDREYAIQGYKTVMQYEKNAQQRAAKIFALIGYYPFYEPLCKTVYQTLIDEILLVPNELNELLRFMKFWSMDCDFALLFDKVNKRDRVMKYINKKKDWNNIDFEDFSGHNYRKLKIIRQELEANAGNIDQIELVPFCKSLSQYFKRCLINGKCFTTVEYLGGMACCVDDTKLLKKIQADKEFLPGLLKGIWIMGESSDIPTGKLKKKWMIPENDTIYMYQNNALLGGAFGGDGFILTNSRICDLKTKKTVEMTAAKKATFNEEKVTIFSESDELTVAIKTANLASENIVRTFFEYLIMTPEELHMIDVNHAVDRITVIIREYAKRNDIKDENKILEDFLIKQQIRNEKIRLLTECKKCGRKFNNTAKFCNFCGEPNPLWLQTCPECGKQIRRQIKFCNFCGFKLE